MNIFPKGTLLLDDTNSPQFAVAVSLAMKELCASFQDASMTATPLEVRGVKFEEDGGGFLLMFLVSVNPATTDNPAPAAS